MPKLLPSRTTRNISACSRLQSARINGRWFMQGGRVEVSKEMASETEAQRERVQSARVAGFVAKPQKLWKRVRDLSRKLYVQISLRNRDTWAKTAYPVLTREKVNAVCGEGELEGEEEERSRKNSPPGKSRLRIRHHRPATKTSS